MEQLTSRKESAVTLFTLILLTGFLGQVEIRPFSQDFRFSLAVPALSLILLYFPAASPVLYSLIAGTVMVLLRGLIAAAGGEEAALILARQVPVLIFYLSFGFAFTAFRVRARTGKGMRLFFCLLVCEVTANLAELFSMNLVLAQPVERAVYFVVLVGMTRSAATAAMYRLTMYWQERHDREQNEERYRRMLLFFSNIKTDLLFFRKSMDDIESAMKDSYGLYEKLKDGGLAEEALAVTRRIHEVKKEYLRLNASMEKVLSGEYVEEPMQLSEIFSLLQSGTRVIIAARKLPLRLSFSCWNNLTIPHYHTLISILNNLIINAVEALAHSGKNGLIEVTARLAGDDCILEVADNGPGISEDLLDCIFEPGFSTKFDPVTGQMSTGIGLAHVKSLVENHCGGRITVHADQSGTRFRIRMPVANLGGGEEA